VLDLPNIATAKYSFLLQKENIKMNFNYTVRFFLDQQVLQTSIFW